MRDPLSWYSKMSQSIKLQTKTFKAGFNYDFIGKTGEASLSYSGAFQVKPANFKMLADHIGRGNPWMSSLLDEDSPRFQRCANTSHLLALDIDSGLTIREAMKNPYARHLGLGIESNSSTKDHNKFRLVFRLPEPITPETGGWRAIKACLVYLGKVFNGANDSMCTDASRFFFGAKGREPFYLSETATLPAEFFDAVIENEIRLDKIRKAQAAEQVVKLEAFLKSRGDGAVMVDLVEDVREALAFVPKRKPKSGNYEQCIYVLMALHNTFGPEIAIQLGEEWSPSGVDHKWDVKYKVNSFRDMGGSGPDFIYIRELAFKHGYRPKPRKRAA